MGSLVADSEEKQEMDDSGFVHDGKLPLFKILLRRTTKIAYIFTFSW